MKTGIALVAALMLSGCIGKTIQRMEALPEDKEGGKVLYEGHGDAVAMGGKKEALYYQKNF